MKKFIAPIIITLCALPLMLLSCSDKNTTEACLYETSLNLDKGNYDAVLQSPCATPMHLGAAYFGKAGYSVTSVVNTFISVQTQTTSNNTALQQYMGELTGTVTPATLSFLDDSLAQFGSITPASKEYRDAQFNFSLVAAVKAESLLKTVIDGAGIGTLSTCDNNSNGIPDEADATTCALLASGSANPTTGTCILSNQTTTVNATWVATGDIVFTSATGTYRGLTVNVGGPVGACSDSYRKLLYRSPADGTFYAATTSGTCSASDGNQWPCPVISSLDLVTALQDSITSSIDALRTAITSAESTDVQDAITEIQSQVCGSDAICTSSEVAAYIQDRL